MHRYNDGDLCPICEGALRLRFEDKNFNYKNKAILIKDYPSFKCEKCGEIFLDEKTIKEFEPQIRNSQKRIDGLLASNEIRAIRTKLGMTQERLAKCLGVSRLTITRYENGQQTQTRSQDIHFRMLKSYPEVLRALAPSCAVESKASSEEKAIYEMTPTGKALNYKDECTLKIKEQKVAR